MSDTTPPTGQHPDAAPTPPGTPTPPTPPNAPTPPDASAPEIEQQPTWTPPLPPTDQTPPAGQVPPGGQTPPPGQTTSEQTPPPGHLTSGESTEPGTQHDQGPTHGLQPGHGGEQPSQPTAVPYPGSPRYGTHPGQTPAPPPVAEPEWQRLSWLSIPVGVLDNLASLLVIVVSVFVIGQTGNVWMLIVAPLALVAQAAASVVAYLHTRFRISGDRLEKTEGFVSRKQTNSRVDRIRTVNITRTFVQRLFGLASLDVETGSDGEQFKIVGVTHTTALALKTNLDTHPARGTATAATPGAHAPNAGAGPATEPGAPQPEPSDAHPSGHPATPNLAGGAGPAPGHTDTRTHASPASAETPDETAGILARIQPNWPWRAGIAGQGLLPAVALLGVLFGQLSAWLGGTLETWLFNNFGELWELLPHGDVGSLETVRHVATQPFAWVMFFVSIVVFLAVSYVANVITYIVTNHNFELRRINSTTLQRSAGLFSITTASIDLDRMRGVQVTDTPIRRIAGLASSRALLTTGRVTLPSLNTNRLLPWSPLATNWQVADALLHTEAERRTPLQRHGPRAARRLLIASARGSLVLTVIAVAFAWGKPAGWWVLTGVCVVFLTVLRTLHAIALHRSRGNALTAGHLLLRSGYLHQTTTVVQRRVALGVRLRQGPFQRWLGLADLHVMDTAQGHKAHDVTLGRALSLAGELTPELVDQFRVRPAINSAHHLPAPGEDSVNDV